MTHRTLYQSAVCDIFGWFSSAERSRDVATLILTGMPEQERQPDRRFPPDAVAANPQPDLRGAYLYHAFLALENLLKGIWLHAHESELGSDVFSRSKVGHHNLQRLLNETGIALTHEEGELLQLAPLVSSLGRFPVSSNPADEFALSHMLDLNACSIVFEHLYVRLRDVLMADVTGD
jgi:hypothetical protein